MIPLITTLLMLSSIFQVLLAIPTWLGGESHISLPAVHRKKSLQNGISMQRASIKYRQKHKQKRKQKSRHADSILSRQPGSTSVASTYAELYGTQTYTCPVLVGGQLLALTFDTGSYKSWVFSTLLPPSSLIDHVDYDPTLGSNYQNLGYPFDVTYVDDERALGDMASDIISIGGIESANQAFGVSRTVSQGLIENPPDGIIGLSFGSKSPDGRLSWFENVQASLTSPVFAAYLPWDTDGVYDIGWIDASKHSGTIVYAPVDNSRSYWEFQSSSYKIGRITYTQAGITAHADTGADLVYMQEPLVMAYYKDVVGAVNSPSDGGYIFPCSSSLPDLVVGVGPIDFATIPGEFLSLVILDGEQCFGGVQILPSGSLNIYGLPFFAANYAIYDISVPQFGFAPRS